MCAVKNIKTGELKSITFSELEGLSF